MEEYYLDNASTTKVNNSLINYIADVMKEMWKNPSSNGYLYNKLSNVRQNIIRYINGDTVNGYVVFTSSGSESNCLAIEGFVRKCIRKKKKPIVITTNIEHKSIEETVKNLKTYYSNVEVSIVPVDCEGRVDTKYLENLLRIYNEFQTEICEKYQILVSIQYANNEIGTIQNIEEIGKIVHKYKGILHTDAVQMFPHNRIDVIKENIDMMSVSGHKFGCPKGTGFLYLGNDYIDATISGSQNRHLRGGTENVPYIMAMNEMIKHMEAKDFDTENNELKDKVDYFIDSLVGKIDVRVNTPINDNSIAGVLSLTFCDDVTGEGVQLGLETDGIIVSTGSACNTHSIKTSEVLRSIGLIDNEAVRTIRISFNNNITYEHIDYIVEKLIEVVKVIKHEKEIYNY